MKKPLPKRTKVTVTLTFSLPEAKNEPGKVRFRIGSWVYHSETPKAAAKLLKDLLWMQVYDD